MRVLDPGRTVASLAFDPAGGTLAAGYFEGVGLWDLAAGGERHLPIGTGRYALGVCVSPDVRRVGVLANDTHHILRPDTGRILGGGVRGWPTSFGRPADHGFLADGRLLVLRADRVHVYDPAVTPADQPCGSDARGRQLRVCPTGRWAAVVGDRLRLWRLDATGRRWDGAEAPPTAGVPDRVQFCGPGRLWLMTDGRGRVWDCEAGDWLTDGVPLSAPPLAVGPDGRRAVVRRSDREVAVIDLAGGDVVRTFDWGVGLVEAAAVAPDGLTAAVAGPGGLIALFDLD